MTLALPPQDDLSGRRAAVTGGGSGIGAASAAALAQAGAEVVILGRDGEKLARAAQALGCAFKVCDVTDEAAVEAALLDGFDILVNNAGAAASKAFAKLTLADWRTSLDANLTGAFLCARAALPGMQARGWGRIVNVASTAALRGYRYVAPYVAAKHGLLGLTRALALEVARSGVTVNAVCPGYVDTEIVRAGVEAISAKTGRSPEEARAVFEQTNPAGRLVAPAEVAAAIVNLCRPSAGAINGAALAVDGGETAG